MPTLEEAKPAKPNIQDRKDALIQKGIAFRDQLLALHKPAASFHVGLWNSFFRNDLRNLEKSFNSRLLEFVAYDHEVSDLIAEMAIVRKVQFEDGRSETINLNWLQVLNLFASQISMQRETTRYLLQEINNTLSSHRTTANNLIATAIAIVSLILAVIALFKS